jgi:stearoyl-CoA desaturase (delta-9 desaturase)
MSAIVATLISLPYTQFRRTKYFYLWYDGFYFALCATLIWFISQSGFTGLSHSWDLELLLLLPLACHLQILCSVWIHNATHNNFPRPINRLVGELCGLVVLTRFASWEIIHQRHHKHSDDPVDDPHPIVPGFSGYWAFLARTVVSVEQQLQKMFFEAFGGRTPENQRFQTVRAVLSFTTSFMLLPYTWYLVLGGPAFWMLFFPAGWVGFFHLIHFNWSTHNPWSPHADYRPVNLNHGFYRVGNWLWHGIYMHGNHHQKTSLFNPAKMDGTKVLPVIRPGDRTDHYPRKKTKSTHLVRSAIADDGAPSRP